MEMLPLVKIVPEYNLSLNPVSGSVGTASEGLIILTMDDVNEGIAKLEASADELMNSLDPNTSPLGAYPGREGAYLTAGMLTNVVYGFLIGMLVLFAAMPLLISLGVL